MATYAAPGVYIEEVPSARQPIAGVGTNTVGFIGLVGDHVWIPVMNPDYDPMLAREALEGVSDDAKARLISELKVLDRQLQPGGDLAKSAEDAQTKVTEATAAKNKAQEAKDEAVAANKPADEIAAANTALNNARTALKKAQEALTKANDAVAKANGRKADIGELLNPPQGGQQGRPEEEDFEYKDGSDPSDRTQRRSELRPYYFEKKKIEVADCDTKLCTNFSEYVALFGDFSGFNPEPENPDELPARWRFKPLNPGHHHLTHAVYGFFLNGGTRCFVTRVSEVSQMEKARSAFESIDEVALIAAPGLPKMNTVWRALQDHAEKNPNVFAILDAPTIVGSSAVPDFTRLNHDSEEPLLPGKSAYSAFYFPSIEVNCPAKQLQDSDPMRRVAPKYRGRTYVSPSGHMAGVYARIDTERGVHKAPANTTVRGALEVKYYISRSAQAGLNPQGVNCLRLFDGAVTVWGARTIGGDKNGALKYINVRRFLSFLEESIDEGTQWVVFEPNDPKLWSRIILNVTSFLTNVWQSGALFGLTPQEAFFVRCDAELNPESERANGRVVCEIGVAVVQPAEFVIFRISQSTEGMRP
jgi:phage tail sheath protein FI